jgi:hypothetical protein
MTTRPAALRGLSEDKGFVDVGLASSPYEDHHGTAVVSLKKT